MEGGGAGEWEREGGEVGGVYLGGGGMGLECGVWSM